MYRDAVLLFLHHAASSSKKLYPPPWASAGLNPLPRNILHHFFPS